MIPKDVKVVLQPHLDAGTITLLNGAKHLSIVRGNGSKMAIPSNTTRVQNLTHFKAMLKRFLAAPERKTADV